MATQSHRPPHGQLRSHTPMGRHGHAEIPMATQSPTGATDTHSPTGTHRHLWVPMDTHSLSAPKGPHGSTAPWDPRSPREPHGHPQPHGTHSHLWPQSPTGPHGHPDPLKHVLPRGPFSIRVPSPTLNPHGHIPQDPGRGTWEGQRSVAPLSPPLVPKGKDKPFTEVTRCHSGDTVAAGRQPPAFLRQVTGDPALGGGCPTAGPLHSHPTTVGSLSINPGTSKTDVGHDWTQHSPRSLGLGGWWPILTP